jgi:hypothetical protein
VNRNDILTVNKNDKTAQELSNSNSLFNNNLTTLPLTSVNTNQITSFTLVNGTLNFNNNELISLPEEEKPTQKPEININPDSVKLSEKTPSPPTLPKVKPTLFTLSVMFSPDYTAHKTSISSPDLVHSSYLTIQNQQVKSALSYTTGIGFSFTPIKGLSIQTGLNYSKRVQKVNYNFNNQKIPVIDANSGRIRGYIIDTSNHDFTTIKSTNTLSYVQIPIMIGYSLQLTNRFSISLKTGGSYIKMTKCQGVNLHSDDLSTEKYNSLKGFNTQNWSYNLQAGIGYKINRKFEVCVEPVYEKMSNNLYNSTNPVKILNYRYGFNTIIKLHL